MNHDLESSTWEEARYTASSNKELNQFPSVVENIFYGNYQERRRFGTTELFQTLGLSYSRSLSIIARSE